MADDPVLPLPVDIPWRRRCVTEDMIDVGDCGRELPPRWQPSIAVFEYEPPESEQIHDDLTVSYLKVTCSITGHTSEELSTLGNLVPYYYDPSVEEFVLTSAEQDACYGALVHVTVQPRERDIDVSEYPFIADFQPKRRELLELVTQTGSTLTRSLDEVQVRKGGTTATNSEIADSDKQIDWSALGAAGGAAAGGALGGPAGAVAGGAIGSELGGMLSGSQSDKPVNQAPTENLLTTDRSVEKREEYSHTTHLSQMYHQLTSYHLGTNRALFFVLPRPHVVQTLRTFVNGPRQLEGIQEFMLTVVRPRSMEHVCVNVIMELAHVRFERGVIERKDPWVFSESANWPKVEFLAPMGNPLASAPKMTAGPYPYEPPPGWEFDLSTNLDGYEVASKPAHVGIAVSIDETTQKAQITLTVPASSASLIQQLAFGVGRYEAHYPPTTVSLRWLIRKKGEEGQQVADIPQRLYTWAHRVCCCPEDERRPWVVSIGYDGDLRTAVDLAPGSPMSIETANQLTSDIGRTLVRSVGSPDRHPYGEAGLLDLQFLADGIARRIDAIGHPDNTPVADIEGLSDEIRERIGQVGDLHRADLLRMPHAEVRDRFGLDADEARHVRRAALRLHEPDLAPEERWLPRSIRDKRPVPNLLGLPVALASELLRASGLTVGEVTVSDVHEPGSVVVHQEPAASEMVRGETRVSIAVTPARTMRMPDLRGRTLADAVCTLRDAGVAAEPTLRFRGAGHGVRFVVAASEPSQGEPVASNTEVVLYLEEAKD